MFNQAFFAGMIISIAGMGFLQAGVPFGAITFAWGLIVIVQLKLKLFTGAAGFFNNRNELFDLLKILVGNAVGCIFTAMMFAGVPGISEAASAVIAKRLSMTAVDNFLMSIGCGIIMNLAVYSVNRRGKYKYLPLFFGIPLFIVCGFPHCIADAFYITIADFSGFYDGAISTMLYNWVCVILGNFVGCNLPRMLGVIQKEERN